ncbi:MAG: thiamine diphosphokinase [Anaeroplasmataceae bacterium]
MKVALFIGNNIDITKYDLNNYYIIGVDKGVKLLLNNNIRCDAAIGDFDSYDVTNQKIDNIIKLNPIKDETDTAYAIKKAYEISNDITIFGGITGSRIEHFLANLCLFKEYDNLKIIDDNSIIYKITSDSIINKDEYKYISLFALEDSILSLKGFKYNLDDYNLDLYNPLCISNEVETRGFVSIKKGSILVIKSKNDNF